MILRRIFGLVALAALVAVVSVAAYAWSSGVRFYAVDSGSMAPTFNTGALVVDQPVTPSTVFHVGDVVTFHPIPGYTATHRIAAIGKDGISTKGDANLSSDVGFIQPSMVVGRVAFSVPYGGYLAVFFQQPLGVAALLLILIALAVVWQMTGSKPASRQAAIDPGDGDAQDPGSSSETSARFLAADAQAAPLGASIVPVAVAGRTPSTLGQDSP